ncbi:TldD/PmbA family protein [Halalkalibacterium halodurans]|uniref:TldD/PmbA family protein n=1 Tax=Halalkalibacterium halodurans TaxID=86665 RepID=UPI002AAA5F34|nr:TldD/PmbA family protein [Halalkalibacterium halodurans]MDY7222590.1 TldD/PmbA family protein [Halalkalibacterium halodurans]MDY7241811.1 TldD/PmbA family protein [Halalkalibacterium halodurans]
MRTYAEYFGEEATNYSWVLTELEHLYSEQKVTGATVRKWTEDRMTTISRQLPDMASVKEQPWHEWNSEHKVKSQFPKRLDPIDITFPDLELYHPVESYTEIEQFLHSGRAILGSIPELTSAPTLHFESEEKNVFYQDTEGRELEKKHCRHTLSVLVHRKTERANVKISCRNLSKINWHHLYDSLQRELYIENSNNNKNAVTSSIILSENGTKEFIKALGNLFIADTIDRSVPALWKMKGKRIASTVFTLKDQAHLPQSIASSPFDDEGVLSQDITILAKGTFQHALHSITSASKHHQISNGRAYRKSFDLAPKIQYTNLLVEPGTRSTENLLKEMKTGFLINRSFDGQIIAGRLMFKADGWKIHEGQRVERISRVRIEAPLFQMLRSIVAVAKDGYGDLSTFHNILSPSIWIKSLLVIY